MIKAVNYFRYLTTLFILFVLSLLIYGFYTVPDEIHTVPDKSINIKEIYSLRTVTQELSEKKIDSILKEGSYKINVKLFNTIPVKTMEMTVAKRRYVVPSGNIFGLRLFTNGVVIVSTGNVETQNGTINPAYAAGLEAGDAIIEINGEKITSCKQVTDIFSLYSGDPYEIKYVRNNKVYSALFSLYFSTADNRYLAGMWIRDSAAGIGTLTYIDKNTGLFAGLGHGVYDAESGNILPLYNGDIVNAAINGCYKGKGGQAGELCGVFTSETCGFLKKNCETGVYGFVEDYSQKQSEIPVALKDEITVGEAQIISTVDSGGAKYYSIEIEKINSLDSKYRNLVIKVTDEELIEKTGGIVQGMSGSPIIQNGMLVGAVTHVFINDPLHGYGIFAEDMVKTADTVIDQSPKKAS